MVPLAAELRSRSRRSSPALAGCSSRDVPVLATGRLGEFGRPKYAKIARGDPRGQGSRLRFRGGRFGGGRDGVTKGTCGGDSSDLRCVGNCSRRAKRLSYSESRSLEPLRLPPSNDPLRYGPIPSEL